MNETLKDIAIVSGALVVGAGLGVAIDVEAPIEPAPIVEEIEKPVDEVKPVMVDGKAIFIDVPVDEKAIFINMPEDKVKVQKWSEDSVNNVQGRIQNRITSLQARKAQLMSDTSPEAQDELINVNKELEAMQSAEAKMEIIEAKVIEAQ